jgi:SAM-dependent methyltransferase
VEITAIDVSARLLRERAPKVFSMLNANASKITRTPGDCHQLAFPDNHFDFVVCSSVLHYAENVVQVLREAKRVLKPGGQFVALREPIWPLVRMKSRSKMMARLVATGYNDRFYTLADYKEIFKAAGLKLETKRVNISTGFKYYLNQVVNGLTHARYAFIATKSKAPAPPRQVVARPVPRHGDKRRKNSA